MYKNLAMHKFLKKIYTTFITKSNKNKNVSESKAKLES